MDDTLTFKNRKKEHGMSNKSPTYHTYFTSIIQRAISRQALLRRIKY